MALSSSVLDTGALPYSVSQLHLNPQPTSPKPSAWGRLTTMIRQPDGGRYEVVKGFANRMIHSKFYKGWYLLMTCTALFTLVLSFMQTCPTPLFSFLEIFINIAMVLEVLVRISAMGNIFWKSWINIVDVFLLMICVATVVVILSWECGSGNQPGNASDGENDEHASEAIIDSVLLIVRNVIQLFRLLAMLKKNQTMMARRARINIDADIIAAEGGIASRSYLPVTQADDLWADELLFDEDGWDVFRSVGSRAELRNHENTPSAYDGRSTGGQTPVVVVDP